MPGKEVRGGIGKKDDDDTIFSTGYLYNDVSHMKFENSRPEPVRHPSRL